MSEFPKTLENFLLNDLIKDIDLKNISEFRQEEHYKTNFESSNKN